MCAFLNRIPDLTHAGGAAKILTVTADENTRNHISRILSGNAMVTLEFAESGRQAIAYLERELPAVVLCDVILPDFDGFKLCRLLKLPLRPGRETVPVILMSHEYRDVIAEHVARKAKAFAYLKLPADLDLLEHVVDVALHKILPSPDDRSLLNHKGTVQLITADEQLAHQINSSLELDGWRIVRETALEPAITAWPSLNPQVVFVDESSGCNGERLHSIAPLGRPVIVALMKSRSSELLVKLLSGGIDDYLSLPVDSAQVVNACRDARLKFNFRSIHDQFEEQLDRMGAVSDYLELVITNSHEAVFTCDLEGRVRLWNKGAERVYGYTAEEIVGQVVDDYLDPPDFKRKSGDIMRLIRQRGSFSDPEVKRIRKSGEEFEVSATYSLLTEPSGEVIGFSVMERDVTPIKALESERIKSARLRAITQTAVTANDHINTPLGIILGYAQFLELKLAQIDEQDKAALETIQLQVHKIKGIMNKLKLISDPIVKNYSIEGVTMLDLSRSKSENEALPK
ncbi:PAS domain S-box protein [bacterium]|nr:PAS domain S-box protein [bacterium]